MDESIQPKQEHLESIGCFKKDILTFERMASIESVKKRVGIYIPDTDFLIPETGGTYSVTFSLIEELDKSEDISNLAVLLVDSLREKELLQGHISTLEIVSIDQPVQDDKRKNYSIRHRIASRVQRILLDTFVDEKVQAAKKKSYVDSNIQAENHLRQVLARNNISLIYYPVQHKCLTTRFPFIATNWDVAHRSTYHFPEIEKIYELREDWYRNVLPRALLIFCESECGKEELINYYGIDTS